MEFPTKKDIDWVVKNSLGRHMDIEKAKNNFSAEELAEVFICVWESGKKK